MKEVKQPMLNFAMLVQTFEMSIRNIRNNRMRSFLTMLGIIIGVGSVISLISIVGFATRSMLGQFSSMGAGSLQVNIYGTPVKEGLTDNELREISQIDNVLSVSPLITVNTSVVKDKTIYKKISVLGRNEQFFLRNGTIREGRALTIKDMSGNIPVCVIDEDAESVLFPNGNALGSGIRVGGIQYRIVGILHKEANYADDFAFEENRGKEGRVFIPYKNGMLMNGQNTMISAEVYTKDTSRINETVAAIEDYVKGQFNGAKDSFYIMNLSSILNAMDTVTTMMSALLGGIASIALLVGGIGIMNMMLVSVTERTREIGLRKALGAEPIVIQIQFLLESMILSLVGGNIGIVIGELISFIASKIIGVPFTVNLMAILIGFLFSVAVGAVFGWAPANRASKLNPIDALRAE